MANPEHVRVLMEGVEAWNKWRDQGASLQIKPDLSDIEVSEEFWLEEADFRWTNLSNAKLRKTILAKANCYKANLSGADLSGAFAPNTTLILADLRNATIVDASLNAANMLQADLSGADLSGTDMKLCHLVQSKLIGANLSGCKIYGASVWESDLSGANQSDLILSPNGEPIITTDNIEIAQFIYLLLNNQKIRHVIDTITSKVVLILGRFTPERKAILEAIRDELRKRNYLPVLFDFEKPSSRDTTETVSTLAHMARFVIADITDAKSIPQELMRIVPALPSVPVQPLLLDSQKEHGMFEHFRRFPWVLEPYLYDDEDGLLAALAEKVIGPAEAKAKAQTAGR